MGHLGAPRQEGPPRRDVVETIELDSQGPELDESPPSSFDKAGITLEEMGMVAATWDVEPTKYNAKLIQTVDEFLLRIAETKTLHLEKKEFVKSVEDLFEEFTELSEAIKTFNKPRRSVKRQASDPIPDTRAEETDAPPDTGEQTH